jgi:hypothetical protein
MRAPFDPKKLKNLEMLSRLGHHAVIGRDDKKRGINAGRASDHVLHEALVTRHIDDSDRPSIRAKPGGEAEIDGQLSRLLFRKPIRINSCQASHEARFPVINVSRRANNKVRRD